MSRVTPSHPKPIPPGESLSGEQVLERTGSTMPARYGRIAARRRSQVRRKRGGGILLLGMHHQIARDIAEMWLRAQATNSFAEVKYLAQQESGVRFVGDVGSSSGGRSHTRGR